MTIRTATGGLRQATGPNGKGVAGVNRRALGWALGLVVATCATPAMAQNDLFRTVSNTNTQSWNDVPRLSEATAILEAVVRDMYKNIEPGRDSSPNELLAYADLRALRLYTGALEVAGWSLEQAMQDYQRYEKAGAYRNGWTRITDPRAQETMERYRAYRETTRTLLYRVRTTAVSVEHQVGFCDPAVAREWRAQVLPALRDTISATEPMFFEQYAFQSYGLPGQVARPVNTANGGIPEGAVDVSQNPTHSPYNKQGRGQGRYFVIRTFGGNVRIHAIRYRSHENAFGLVGTSTVRELSVEQDAAPGSPLYVACNRGRWADISELEVDWEVVGGNRRTSALIELVDASPNDPN
jgi:hypothetical protein